MASYKVHFQDCQKELGNGWAVVHHWLDEMARIYRNESGDVWMGHTVHPKEEIEKKYKVNTGPQA